MFVSSFVNGCGCLLANPLDINKGAFVFSTGKCYYFNQKVSVEIFQKILCNTNESGYAITICLIENMINIKTIDVHAN